MAADLTGMWPDASRGLPQPDMNYLQALTPVNMNDPVELARWQAKYGQKTPAAASPLLPAAPTLAMTQNAQGVWEPSAPKTAGGADLSGLAPLRQASRQVLANSFDPGGAVDPHALQDLINRELWGTGESAGVYSGMARRGLNELQPETQYATSRVVRDSIQQLADQYAARQRAAIETGRTTEMTEPNFRLTEAGVTGQYGNAPTLASQLGNRGLDIQAQSEATKQQILQSEQDWRKNLLLGSMAGGLVERSGLMDWLFGSQTGKAGATGGGGVAGQATQGVLSTAAKKAWDLITGAAQSTPYLSTAPLSAEAVAIAQNLVAQGIPQNIAYEAANATAVEGLSPAGESISNFLAGFSSAPAPAAGVAAGVGTAAPSVEAGIIEMLGPELAAKLGYTAAPATAGVTAGLAGADVGAGLTPAAIEAMTGLAAGGEAAVGGAGAAGLGLGASTGALALPLLAYGLISSGILGFGKGGAFRGEYQDALGRLQSPEKQDAANLARLMLDRAPDSGDYTMGAMERFAAVNQIIDRSGARPSIGDIGGYNIDMAPTLAQIMRNESRWPTAAEVLAIYQRTVQARDQAAADEWRQRSYMGDFGR